jgi:pyochelin synthetase
MNALDLIAHLENEGVRLWEDGGDLRFRAPSGVMTPERQAELSREKENVIALLRRRNGALLLVDDPKARHEPFPLTDLQSAYLIGRGKIFPYGGTGCHGYAELLFPELDGEKLTIVWNRIIRRHEMLRAIVNAYGLQRILSDVPACVIPVQDLRGLDAREVDACIGRIRAEMDHRLYDPTVWPLFELRLTLTAQGALLHFSIDLLMVDMTSTNIVLDELQRAYFDNDDPVAPTPSFRDYVIGVQNLKDGAAYRRDREYWLGRIHDLPSRPDLPLSDQAHFEPTRFERHQIRLDPNSWATLSARARSRGVTASAVILAAYAEVIGRASAQAQFTLNLPLQNRLPVHPEIVRVVGEFTSVELLAVKLDPATPFVELVRRLQDRLWEDLDHRLFSGAEVIREISHQRGPGDALFPVVFTAMLDARFEPSDREGAFGRLCYGITQTPQVWIDCQVMASHGGLVVNCDVRDEVFRPGVVEALVSAFDGLLGRLSHDEAIWDEADPLNLPLSAPRLAANATEGPLPDRLLHENFVAQALGTPERIALIDDKRTLNYGELLHRARSVSAFLRGRGSLAGELVGVMLTRRSDQVIAVLGILMAGCVYVPIETDHPPLRRANIVAACAIRSIICDDSHRSEADQVAPVRLVTMDELAATSASGPDSAGQDINGAAYVIHTSGSTGAPKGVIVSHLSAANTVADINRRFNVGERDRVLALAALGFDLSVYDIFGPLSVGGCIVVPNASRRADPSHWAHLIAAHGVTVWNSVPAQLQMLHDYLRTEASAGPLTSLRLGLLSGDWIPLALPDRVRELLPDFQLISLGGATEAAIWSIHHPIVDVSPDWRSIPYGRPLTNQTVHVLDSAMRPCPDWVKGEIFIGGLGLAIGYLGDQQKTAERFVRHPRTGERLYRTGDAGRFLPDGSVELLGRLDRQVKIRGHRIELGEIEAALRSHPRVENGAVVLEGATQAEFRLVAFALAKVDADAVPLTIDTEDLVRCVVDSATALQAAAESQTFAEYAAELDHAAMTAMWFAIRQYDRQILATGAECGRTPWIIRRSRRMLGERPSRDAAAIAQNVSDAQIDEAWQRVRRRGVGVEAPAVVDGLRDCVFNFIDSFRSKRQAPTASFHSSLSDSLVRDALLSRWARRVIAGALSRIARDASRPLRVLEFGAAAPITREEAGLLAGLDLDVTVTDPSSEVLDRNAQGRAHFVTYRPDMDFRIQDFEANSFDVIIVCNMLHRTIDIEESLRAVRELLVPGGWLLAAEMTQDNPATMLALEPLLRLDQDGEAFCDARRGRDRVCLTEDEWKDLFVGIGARPIIPFVHHDTPLARFGMQVFAACLKRNRFRLDPDDVRQFMARRLPEQMVPARLHVVDALPLTANGKVDTRQLATWIPKRESFAETVDAGATSDLEQRIAVLWAEILNAPEVPFDRGFLRQGGDSLGAAKLAGRMRERLPEAGDVYFDRLLRSILEEQTIHQLAETLQARETVAPPIAGATFSVRTIAGSGPPVRALVHDASGSLIYCQPLVSRLSECGTVVGLAVSDIGSYIQINPDSLVARAAQSYVDGLIDGGFLRLDVIGSASGVELAVEIARQLLEAGAIVDRLVIVDGSDRSSATTPASLEDHLVEHSRRAFVCGAPATYAGDITIVGMRGHTDALELLAARCRTVSLGKVDIVVGEADRIVAEFFGPDGADSASQEHLSTSAE